MRIILFQIIFLLLSNQLFAYINVDSLKTVLKTDIHDSIKIPVYNNIAKAFSKNNPTQALVYADSAIYLAKKLTEIIEIANANMHKGIAFRYLGEYDKSLNCFQQSLKLYEKENNLKYISGALMNIGTVYWTNGNINKALEFYNKALEIIKKTKDNYSKGICYINLGILSAINQDYDKSEKYFLDACILYKSINDIDGVTRVYNNLAQLAIETNDFEKAEQYAIQGLNIRRENNDDYGIASSLIVLASIKISQKKFNEALSLLNESYNIASTFKFKDLLKDASLALSNVYAENNDFKNSLKYYKIYGATKDSLFNESKSKEIGKLEANYEFEKKLEEEKRLANELKQKQKAERERKNTLQYSGIFVFVLILFAFAFMSGKFSMNTKTAEGLIFFTFLLFFEFCLILLDPLIDKFSSGEPLYKLLFNAVLAAAIFPLHAFFENTLKKKLFSVKRKFVSSKKDL